MKTKFSFISVMIALTISFAIILSPVAAESSWYTFTLALDGIDDFASTPDNSSLDLGASVDEDFKISLRFYVPDLTNNGTDTLVWKNGAYGLYIVFSSTTPDHLIFRVYDGLTTYVTLNYETEISTGWQAITARFDNEYSPTEDLIAVSLNSPEVTFSSFDFGTVMNTTSSLYVGGYGTMNPASGWIEELKITANESDVRAWWHFDEDWEDTVFLDSSLYGNTLTGQNGAQIGNPTGFPPLPGDFNKISPTNALFEDIIPLDVTLSWGASLYAFDGYEYCVDTSNNRSCDTSWVSSNETHASPTGLTTDTVYYWQVRAKNSSGTWEADSGSWWAFHTVPLPPTTFGKYLPANGSNNQPINDLQLIWHNSSGMDRYDYCIDTEDDDVCQGGWTSTLTAPYVYLSTLEFDTTYYYQVKAVNNGGETYADGGEWWSFTTLPQAPAAFGKSSPISGAIDQPGIVPISWESSIRATSYEYCLNYNNNTSYCENGWISAESNTSADANVGIDYWPHTWYWQVRALNSGGTTYANDGNWWSFTTLPPAPREIQKKSPGNGSPDQPKSLTLSWFDGVLVDEYEYCYDTTPGMTCEGSWTSTGTETSVVISNLLPETTYYWQMRATNSGGTTYANEGGWWSFTTIAVPGSFDKIEPSNDATGIAKNVNFYWFTNSTSALTYEYCYDTSINNNCDTSWVTDNNISNYITGLDPSTTYNWQVRAGNSMGFTYANNGTWWQFTTGTSPASFGKTAPLNGVVNQPLDIVISWEASTSTNYYEYCYDNSDDDACSTWLSTTGQGKALNGLNPYTTYFWQVRAVNSFSTVYADELSSDFWSFTTGGVPGAFDKSIPANGATNVSINPVLSWEISLNANGYYYCLTTSDTCTDWSIHNGGTSMNLLGLLPNTTYYWHIKAVNLFGTTYSGGSESNVWSFTTGPKPEAFERDTPTNGATDIPADFSLVWNSSAGASRYEFCFVKTLPCDDHWIDNGSSTSVSLSGGESGTTYYWHVRAINEFGTTYAGGEGSDPWTLTIGDSPDPFEKITPANGDGNQPPNGTILIWNSSGDFEKYEYCVDRINNNQCDASWTTTDIAESVTLFDLWPGFNHYWQVRAVNSAGNTEADNGTWYSFFVPYKPSGFSKISPINGASNRPSSLGLSWEPASFRAEYQYCLKLSGGTCSWISTGINENISITGLEPGIYKWQARALNATGITSANDGIWWSFTVPPKPGAFYKTSPLNGVINKPTDLTLYWQASTNAASYQYCIKLKLSDVCQWKSTGLVRNVTLTGLLNNTRYFWQVRARNASGITLANNGTWWNFTTVK